MRTELNRWVGAECAKGARPYLTSGILPLTHPKTPHTNPLEE